MSVRISSVDIGSMAQKAGILSGDTLISINGHDIRDILDYRFFETERELRLSLIRNGRPYEVKLKKPQYAEIGLEFSTYLMDKQQSCRNGCVFCFIDQLPKGMRKTLYFKDDDDRLSFLFGNYITLTNIDDREVERILQMHISPINVSVHTMDPQLRVKMMRNRSAGESLKYLYRLAGGGIKLNCQIVLCPGINDGEALRFTLSELFSLGEGLLSVACVPVGLTRYRKGLFRLEPFNEKTANDALNIIEEFGEKFLRERGSRTVYASDELYIMANREIPPIEFYEDFPQIENGVGMLRNLQDEFFWAMDELEEKGELKPDKPRRITVPTGECGYRFIRNLLDECQNKCHNLNVELIPVHNDFFGGTVNVTGLLTGQDLLKSLKDRDLGDELLIASNMLRADEDVFLDDVTLTQLGEQLNIPVRKFGNSGEAMLCALLGREAPSGGGHNPYEASWEHR